MVKNESGLFVARGLQQMFEGIPFSDMFIKELGHAITLLHCKLSEHQDTIPATSLPFPFPLEGE